MCQDLHTGIHFLGHGGIGLVSFAMILLPLWAAISSRARPAFPAASGMQAGRTEWTDVSAWYWAALWHPLNGPWQAETVIGE